MGRSRGAVPKKREPGAVALPADLGIEHAGGLHALLLPHAAEPQAVTLDAGAIARLHAAALQMLFAFCRERRDAGLQTLWSAPSETLRSAAATLGMTDLLGLPSENA